MQKIPDRDNIRAMEEEELQNLRYPVGIKHTNSGRASWNDGELEFCLSIQTSVQYRPDEDFAFLGKGRCL